MEPVWKVFDLLDLGLLPSNWDRQVIEVAQNLGKFVHLDGDNKDSFDPQESGGTDYYVVTGEIAAEALPWLKDLYLGTLADIASQAIGSSLVPAAEIRNGININVLNGNLARYEWHVDPNPVSGILYATSHEESQGGGLVIKSGEGEEVVRPRAGHFVVFEGGRLVHSVEPLNGEQIRVSVPLLFYHSGQDQIWPKGLDVYLYGE